MIGVYEKYTGVWEARLKVGGKTVHRSRHGTIDEAAAARAEAVRKYCGEYAPKFSQAKK